MGPGPTSAGVMPRSSVAEAKVVGTIIRCEKCGQKNRIRSHEAGLAPVCGRCKASLKGVEKAQRSRRRRRQAIQRTLKIALLPLVLVGMFVAPRIITVDLGGLERDLQRQIQQLEADLDQALEAKRQGFEAELLEVDRSALRNAADERYRGLLADRLSRQPRFALTEREQSQLRIKELSSLTTKSLHEAIREMAREAAPRGSEISVREVREGVQLYIDFEMSSLTSGERGTRTKHETVPELRAEVLQLVSRVANDLFLFSKSVDLASIHVGCRHDVLTMSPEGREYARSRTLYRVRVDRRELDESQNNPFLEFYAVSDSLKVELDVFDEITIKKSRRD